MARPSSPRQLVSNELRRGCSPSAGFAGTSPQDIADSMGVSRRNRDELLAALVHAVLDPTVRLIEEVPS